MSKPEGSATVVLVHGAFADASSWAPVLADLRASGVSAVAPANPLRGVAADAAYSRASSARSRGRSSSSVTPTAAPSSPSRVLRPRTSLRSCTSQRSSPMWASRSARSTRVSRTCRSAAALRPGALSAERPWRDLGRALDRARTVPVGLRGRRSGRGARAGGVLAAAGRRLGVRGEGAGGGLEDPPVVDGRGDQRPLSSIRPRSARWPSAPAPRRSRSMHRTPLRSPSRAWSPT